ncbi:MFS transporter [Desulfovibrio aerotolerans]|uniref:MFS transporter n=1 Tax=Solidesulfovibrio aerotolerans TaxID=295255 RepID=A0A7C9MP61_9BACT|nr:MFS transporter [Solidesulfovibrio aerotolerans]MYL83412.1 MFS transporter [Solidesulfovibrio aerotolerans]
MASEIFGNRAFTRFWTARSASGFAYHMTAVAVGWQVYDLTGSALMLGLVGLVEFLPQFLLTLVVGQVADRFDRRRIAGVCQLVEAAALLLLLAEAAGGLLGLGGIFACVALIGAARAFETPTLQALLPSLVAPESLPRMLAWSGSVWKTAMILGPAAGGVLFMLGPGVVYGLGALVYVLASLAVLSIPAAAKVPAPAGSLWSTALDGLRFIRRRPIIFGAISLDLFSVLLGGATSLLPVFARDILAVGPGGLGALRAAPALGALAMSLYLTRFPLKRRVGRTMFAAVAVFGLSTIVFGLSRSFPLSVAALAVLGAGDMISVVIRSTLVQIDTPDALRGRVSAVNAVFIGTSNQLGDFESGLIAAALGATGAVVVGGLGALVVVALWMRFFPELARRDRLVPHVPAVGRPGET